VAALRRTLELLERLRTHPLWDEITSAAEAGWQVVDFKTDSIRSARERNELVSLYRRQMSRYGGAVAGLLGGPAQVRICFLDDDGRVETVNA